MLVAVAATAAVLAVVAAVAVGLLMHNKSQTSIAAWMRNATAASSTSTLIYTPSATASTGYASGTGPAYTTYATTTTEAPTTSAAPAPVQPSGPAAVVRSYYDAINQHDFRTAYHLRADSSQGDYDTFASGYASTSGVELTVESVSGNTVYIQLTAHHYDGTTLHYTGYYGVENGLIISASISQN